MEQLNASARERVLEVIEQGRDLTLATLRPDGYPQATTISYISDGLTLYAGIGLGSQKATNVAFDRRVSAAITLDYESWNQIRGLSLAAHADFVRGAEELERIGKAFLRKFPQLAQLAPVGAVPLQSILFLRIQPIVISLLDYRMGFGHTELYTCHTAAVRNGDNP